MSILVDSVETETQAPNVDPAPVEQAPVVPEKFAGKSVEEVAEAYTHLESELGRLRNQLGDYRNITDRFLTLEEKRADDLKQGGREEFEIDPTELLANPHKVLDDYFEHRKAHDPGYGALEERLNRLEAGIGQQTLEQQHSDAVEITNDPEFQNWVRSDSYRARIAAQAVNARDSEALSYLLTQWKEVRGTQGSQPNPQTEVQRARQVSTTQGASGTATDKSQKRFSRRKLVELRMTNPDEYSAMADEILLAYSQGRVDD